MPMILIVEDRNYLRLLVEGALRGAGHDTCWTDATETARAILAGRDGVRISLMVLDCSELREVENGPLLHNQGMRFLSSLRADPRYSRSLLPVIATTIHLPEDGTSYKEALAELGADAYYEYPLSLRELVRDVGALLG